MMYFLNVFLPLDFRFCRARSLLTLYSPDAMWMTRLPPDLLLSLGTWGCWS